MLEVYKNVLTEKGADLHARTIAGEQLTLTGFAIGDGTYTGTESEDTLAGYTALKSQRKRYAVSQKEALNAATCRVKLVATNEEITTSFPVTEIGIFAMGEDNVEVLYSLLVADPEHPGWMSAYNQVAPGALEYFMLISVGNADNVTIQGGHGGALLDDDIATAEETAEYLGITA